MKYLRLYETKSIQSIKNIIDSYHNFLEEIKPLIIIKYNELAEDDDYYPDMGDKPSDMWDPDLLVLNNVDYYNNEFVFILHGYDNDGILDATFIIPLTEEEMKDELIKMDAQKYNI